MIPLRPIIFFCVAPFLMDLLFSIGLLSDAFFADAVFKAQQWHQGVLGCAGALGYSAGCLVFGPLSEKTGRRKLALAGAAGVSVCTAALAFCPSFRVLVALSVAKRFAISMFWPAVMAWMAEASSPKQFGRNLGVFNMSWCVGGMLGSASAGRLGMWAAHGAGRFNPAAPYLLSAALGAVLFLFLCLFDPRAPRREPAVVEPMDPFRARLFLAKAWIAHFALYSSMALTVFMLPRLAARPGIGIDAAGQSLVHAVRSLACLAGFAAMLTTRHWHFRFYPIYGALALAGTGLALTGAGNGFAAFAAGQSLLGFAVGVGYSVSLFYSLGLPKTKGKGSAAHEALIGLGNAAGPALGGGAAYLVGNARAPFFAGLAPVILAAAAATMIRGRLHAGRRNRKGESAVR